MRLAGNTVLGVVVNNKYDMDGLPVNQQACYVQSRRKCTSKATWWQTTSVRLAGNNWF